MGIIMLVFYIAYVAGVTIAMSKLTRRFFDADRGRPRQEGHCHLRPRSPPAGLPQDPAAVRKIPNTTSFLDQSMLMASPQVDAGA